MCRLAGSFIGAFIGAKIGLYIVMLPPFGLESWLWIAIAPIGAILGSEIGINIVKKIEF